MELIVEEEFGLETVTVGGKSLAVDVCKLADELYDALSAVPEGTEAVKETQLAGAAAAAVFEKWGWPAIGIPAAAYKFAVRVCVRALELKKSVGDVWRSLDGPASPEPIPDSTSAN
jgi:hypothetical protein